jgi:SAM-dependent methyltransferase
MSIIAEGRRDRIEALGFDYDAQPKRRVTSCNLCGERVFITLAHRDRYHYSAEAAGCARCGLVFLNPVMTADAYGRFYEDIYRPLVGAFHGRLIDARTIQDEQREYAEERIRFLEPFFSGLAKGALLDIGGSTGVVAHAIAKRFGLSGTVVDPAPLEAAEARRLGLETIAGLVERVDLGSRQFDAVIVCQTVDHLLDIAGTLSRVRSLLRGRGLLFIDIVDFRAVCLRNWSVEDAVKIDHPYSLTHDTMTVLLARSGFEILAMDWAADHLHVGYVCRPGAADGDALPSVAGVAAQWRELRFIQNAPKSHPTA